MSIILTHEQRTKQTCNQIINTYALSTGAWLALQATPLLLTPKLIITMLSEDMHEPSCTIILRLNDLY
jgi:hypothetical protein